MNVCMYLKLKVDSQCSHESLKVQPEDGWKSAYPEPLLNFWVDSNNIVGGGDVVGAVVSGVARFGGGVGDVVGSVCAGSGFFDAVFFVVA